MANRAETTREPQSGWGWASRVARGSVLAISLVAGVSILQAEPLEADATRSDPSTSVAIERTTAVGTSSQALSAPQMSVSAFSAAQSDAARVLLAQELSGESNRAVGTAPFPATPQAAAAPRTGEAQDRLNEAAEAKEAEESVIVGRSLRAFTRGEEESEASSPRRRASFSSAISRAAASGALTSTNPNASIGNSLNAARFTPNRSTGQFDPGFSEAAEVLSVVPGLRLQSATIFGGYSSNTMPRRNFAPGTGNVSSNQNLGADYDLGASAILSYSHQGRRSLTQFTYTPSHVQRSRIPEWSTTDHRLSFSSSRDLTPRLSLRASGNAGNSGLEQFWMRPAVIRTVDAPASFAELMNKVLAGEINNDEFAAILTGSPVVDDPGGTEQGLTRVFSASLGTTASYAHSRRVTLNFGASSSMNRVMAGVRPTTSGDRYLRHARTTNATASAQYRLSSRTRISATHLTSLADSSFARSVAHNPSVSVDQTLSRHWRYQLGAGVGRVQFDDSRYFNINDRTTWTANGMLGYTSGAHQVSLSASKRIGDPLGFGSRSTVMAHLMWNLQPRFSPWGATAGLAFSRSDFLIGSIGKEFASDLYSAGLSRRLTPSTTFRSDYYYGEFISPFSGIASNMSLHRLQLSLVWRPVEQR